MDTNAVKVTLWGMDVGYLSWDNKIQANKISPVDHLSFIGSRAVS